MCKKGGPVQIDERPGRGRRILLRRKQILLAMTAGSALLAGLSSAEAQFFWPFGGYQRPTVTRYRAPAVRHVKPEATKPSDVAREKVNEKGKETEKAAVKERPAPLAAKADGVLTIAVSLNKQQLTLYSDGAAIARSRVAIGPQTPTGVFSIIQKERFHRSDSYGDAPYLQRITKSGLAIYQAAGQANPQGSIRLPDPFARQLWDATRVGARVIITRGEITPATVSNPRLFARRAEPTEHKPEALSSAKMVESAYSALGAAPKRAAKPRDPALDAFARSSEREPANSSEVVRSAYDEFDFSKARRSKFVPSAGPVAEFQPLRPGPISMFISRKEGKLFVRKGFEPVFSSPVSFQQPERPLGTHVFTAVTSNDDDSLRWSVVTVPTDWSRSSGKGRTDEPISMGKPSTAADVLDRVTIPEEAINRISDLMSEGASLIVSDQGLSPETGRGTDFVVLTR
jgi:hypothetical protein